MSMAMSPPPKPRPARLECVNNVYVWTDPDMERRTVELRDDNGRVLLRVKNVATIHVGEGR